MGLVELEQCAGECFCDCGAGKRERALALQRARSWEAFSTQTAQQNAENSTKRNSTLLQAGVPALFRGLTLTGLREKSRMPDGKIDPSKELAINAARHMMDRGYVLGAGGVQKNSLLLWGATSGVGKTTALVSVFEKWQAEGRDCLFIPFASLLEQVRKGYKDNLWFERIERVKTVDVLFLDDLGSPDRDATDHVREIALELFRHRHSEKKQTLVTTNHSHDSLAKQLGEYLYRRVAEMCVMVEMGGKVLGSLG